MKIFKWGKDGGPNSNVDGLFVIEIKSLFSIVLLKFNPGVREAFHSHAFDALSWTLKGEMIEEELIGFSEGQHGFIGSTFHAFPPSFKPKYTPKERMHRVESEGTTWVLTIRGPWQDTWKEFRLPEKKLITLTHGRKEI